MSDLRALSMIATAAAVNAAAIGLPKNAVSAATIDVPAKRGQLTMAIDRAMAGDTLRLAEGVHHGPITITKSLGIIGAGKDTVIRGNGSGSVITVKAPSVSIDGLTVTGSGLLLETQDSGIFLSKEATGARVLNSRVLDNLIGIYVWGARNALIRANTVRGRRDLRVNERGNGVQIWNAPGARVEDNDIRYGRDGIFVTTSKRNVFADNVLQDLRFGVHYMYTNSSRVTGNISRRNHLGYAIMFSHRIDVLKNRTENDRDRGILFNYANRVTARGNILTGGPRKCVFICNSNRNSFSGNLFQGCTIGIHFTSGSERNLIHSNALVRNRTQVKYVGTRWVEWNHKGRGNFWSDHTAFDLDRDGIADAAYRPNGFVDQILWQFPAAKLLTNSPAVLVLKWAHRLVRGLAWRPAGS